MENVSSIASNGQSCSGVVVVVVVVVVFDVDYFLKSLLNLSYIVSVLCFGFSL